MKPFNPPIMVCRHCKHYTPQGRRGGACQMLGVPVRSGWKACSLSLPPFAPTWEGLEEMLTWTGESAIGPGSSSLEFTHQEVSVPQVRSSLIT